MARTITLETRVNHQRFAQGISTMTKDLNKFQRTAGRASGAITSMVGAARGANSAGQAVSGMFSFATDVALWKGIEKLIGLTGRLGGVFKGLSFGVSAAGAAITAIGAMIVGMIGSISSLSSEIGKVQNLEKTGSGIDVTASNESLKSQLADRQKLLDKAKKDAKDYDSFWSSPIAHIFETAEARKHLANRSAKVFQKDVNSLTGEIEHRSLVGTSVNLEQRRFNFGSAGGGPDQALRLQQQSVDYLRTIANNSKPMSL